MGKIDDELKFHLSKSGWYVGDSKISVVKDTVKTMGVDGEVRFTNSGRMAWTDGKTINLSESFGWLASLPQIELMALHEHYHKVLGHCHHHDTMPSPVCHKQEYDCDRLALRHMLESGRYNDKELYDAIAVFLNVIVEDESDTHPSSKNRYKRLLRQLKEYV